LQTAVKNERPTTRATWLNLGDAYAYIYCLMMSYLLVGVSVPGGALYMCGRVASMLFSGTWGEYNRLISKRTRIISAIGLTVLMLVSALVAVFYPVQEVNSMMWLLFAAILTMTIGDILGWRLVYLSLNRGMEEKRFILHLLYANTILRGGVVELDGGTTTGRAAIEVIEDLNPVGPVHVSLKLPRDVSSVKIVPKGKTVPFEKKNGRLEFEVPQFTCHSMIELA